MDTATFPRSSISLIRLRTSISLSENALGSLRLRSRNFEFRLLTSTESCAWPSSCDAWPKPVMDLIMKYIVTGRTKFQPVCKIEKCFGKSEVEPERKKSSWFANLIVRDRPGKIEL